MKITKDHYQTMKNAIDALPRDQIATHKALKLGKDIDMRFRWDLFSAAKLHSFASDKLYQYANDTHIDTALKSIVKELQL